MIPAAFAYEAPATLAEAFELLAQHGDEAKILSGGHSLIPLLKLRLARPQVLVDLRQLSDLQQVSEVAGTLHLGALATHARIGDSALLGEACPLLRETARQIGDLQVRNVGTLGGSLVHGDPASDWPAAMLALDARMVLKSKEGEREVVARDFFVGLMESAARTGEILTSIQIPRPTPGSGCCYLKVPQTASGFALVGVAVQLSLQGERLASVAVGITGLGDVPFRAYPVEQALQAGDGSADSVEAAAARAGQDVVALDDLHASARFRGHLARVLTARSLTCALERARGASA